MVFDGYHRQLLLGGIITLFFGPVFVRILCELVLTFFRKE